MRKLKEYTLDNGDVVTSQSLRDLGLTKDMVYYRLKKSTDPKLIYKGLKKNKKEPLGYTVWRSGKRKKMYMSHILDDGTKITAHELMEKTGLTYAGAKNRLNKYTDPNKIFKKAIAKSKNKETKLKLKPKKEVKQKEAKWGTMSKEREALQPMSDPLYRLMLKTI